MIRPTLLSSLLLGLLAAAPEPTAPPTPPALNDQAERIPTIDAITNHLDDLYRSKTSHGTMTMKVVTRRYERTMTLEQWTMGKDNALVVIRKPAREAGNATLKRDDGLWSYGRRSDRLIRIPSNLLGQRWMGSHFTNDDLLRESSYQQDYVVSVSRAEDAGQPRLRVEMVPKPDAAVVYTRLVFWLRTDDWLPVRLDYHDKDEVVRRMHFEDIRPVGGKTIPARVRLVPVDKPSESTVVDYAEMAFDVPVKATMFTPQGLKRAAQR